ncbi:zinc metalloprotease [Sphingomonas metalli]|uniref:Zinc metalloprotease n=1 Tax=Sphingomonas metalli TaxID=1779358 RepID=A0A916WXN5_9SPHN|nr:SprT family zinc-dependent metalloprotease [Sphingomonas metalli]GGB38623.1 zinc metalloprotease [Sphingomonas metalli]
MSDAGGGIAGLEIVRHARARRCTLSVDPASGRARLVLPRRAPLQPALAWAQGKAEWLAAQRAKLPVARPFAPGTVLTVADRALTIVREEGPRRALLCVGDELRVAGPEETIARRVEAWLRRAALDRLTEETAEYAARAGVTVAKVAVGDPLRRWGSCAATGVIRYSWRLILAPGCVRRATVAHEVAHRVHMNHGPAFHALVAELYGADPAPSRAWLRAHGAGLHWIGRTS